MRGASAVRDAAQVDHPQVFPECGRHQDQGVGVAAAQVLHMHCAGREYVPPEQTLGLARNERTGTIVQYADAWSYDHRVARGQYAIEEVKVLSCKTCARAS